MKTHTILEAINALPKGQRIFIAEKILHSIRKDDIAPVKKKEVFPKNPDNPSPSGDPWYDDPRNLAIVEEAVREHKEGKVAAVSLDEDEELQAIFAWARQ